MLSASLARHLLRNISLCLESVASIHPAPQVQPAMQWMGWLLATTHSRSAMHRAGAWL